MQTHLGFTYRTAANGTVYIARHGRPVTVLRAKAAAEFLAKAQGASADKLQQLCARVTGNYKRGNESTAGKTRQGKGGSA